ncbi:hypothetical protein [Flavobacterium notoginsengisoli]|uniref:hypothetical protein n=1 Tax=Flavobacterium notoginsengisoli TaxID=1478199 RepID=UPI0036369A23
MKKYLKMSLVLCCMGTMNAYTQVGMPTNNPNKNSVLDLNRTDGTSEKGLLLPKVALKATNNVLPMSAHVAGMYVYNTATDGTGGTAVTPGEYYNDGTEWLRMPTAPWNITGNAGTNASTNFLGTTDAVDLAIKTNNTEQMRITKTGNVLVGTTTVPTGGTNAKLIVNNGTTAGALQIIDGSQADGKVLTSDANGVGSWELPATQSPINATLGAAVYLPSSAVATGTWFNSGTTITLPPGKWLVSVDMLLAKEGGFTAANETWWIRSTFSNSPTTMAKSPDIISVSYFISGLLPSSSQLAMMKGSVVINNTSTTNKTYYYIVGSFDGMNVTGRVFTASSTNAENRITYQRIY